MVKRATGILLAVVLLISLIPAPANAALHTQNKETIYQFLTGEMGLSNATTAGIMANLYYETMYEPNSLGDNGTSFGICGWHATRFTELREWCVANAYDYTTLDAQLHFLQHDLTGKYSYIRVKVSGVEDSAQGAFDAAYYFCKMFERPADTERRAVERGRYARDVLYQDFASRSPEKEKKDKDEEKKSYQVRARVNKTSCKMGDTVKISASASSGYQSLRLDLIRANPEGIRAFYRSVQCTGDSVSLRFELPGTYYCTFTAVYADQTVVSSAVQFEVMDHPWQTKLVRPATSEHSGLLSSYCAECGKLKTETVSYPNDDEQICPSARYEDVNDATPYHDGIDFVTVNKLLDSTATDTFGPAEKVSRIQLVLTLWKLAGKPADAEEHDFKDAPKTAYYTQALNWAAENGIVEADKFNRFRPNNDVTRVQLAQMLYRYAEVLDCRGEITESLQTYADADQIDTDALTAMRWSVQQELLAGELVDGRFMLRPNDAVTRAELAAALQQFANQFA